MCLKKDPSVRSSSADLLSHPFIEGVTDFRPLRVLYQERRAEVVEVVEDLPEDADIMHREIQHVVREEGGQTGSCTEGEETMYGHGYEYTCTLLVFAGRDILHPRIFDSFLRSPFHLNLTIRRNHK